MKETRGWKKKVVEARGDSAAHAVGHGVSTSLKRRRERIKKRRERFELNESLEEKIYDGPELKGSSRWRKGQLVASVSESVEIEVGDGASASGNKRGRKRARVKPLNQSLEKKKCQGNDSSVEAVARRVRNSAKLAAEDVICESEKIGVGVEAYDNLKNRLRRGRQRRTMLEKMKSVKERWKKSKGQGNDSSVEAVDLRESKRTKLAEDGVSESEDVEGVGASEVLGSSVKCQESLMCHQCQRNDKGRVVSDNQ